MGSNCQLSPETSNRIGRRENAVPGRVRSPTRFIPRVRACRPALACLLLVGGCGDDAGSGDAGTTGGDGSTDVATTGPTEPATGATGGADATTDPDGSDSGPVTGEAGPNFGLLTFTLYPADASGAPDLLGMAGAWRVDPFTTDDFYAVRALGLLLPPAPAQADTLELHEPSQYDWGKASDWVTLGNGVRLGHASADAVACLQLLDASYPVYFSDDAAFLDPVCAADPARWEPAATYDLVVYGGADFDDQSVAHAVTTPAALTVRAPDPTVFDFPLDKTADLALTWDDDGGDGDRVVIRVRDRNGKQLAVHAADDGSYTLAGSELDKLAAGPVDLTVARERIVDIGLPAGTLRVAARYEVALYPDLF